MKDNDTPDFAIFIASSDNTADVFERVYPAYAKHWNAPGVPIFVGHNTEARAGRSKEVARGRGAGLPDFTPVLAEPSGWRSELREQLSKVPHERVILMLDDFLLLGPTDVAGLREVARRSARRDLPYVCLTVAHRPYLPRLLLQLWDGLRGRVISRVPSSMPYYATLQAALWKKSHLMRMLERPGSIWEFEHDALPGQDHYIYTGPRLIDYLHVVEKGRWLPNAEAVFNRSGVAFDPGTRETHPEAARYLILYNMIKYHVIGYAFVRIKRRLTGKI